MTLTAGSDERRIKHLSNLSTAGTWSDRRRSDHQPRRQLHSGRIPGLQSQPGLGRVRHQRHRASERRAVRHVRRGRHRLCPERTVRGPASSPRSASIRTTRGAGRCIAGVWINTPFGNGNQDHFGCVGTVRRRRFRLRRRQQHGEPVDLRHRQPGHHRRDDGRCLRQRQQHPDDDRAGRPWPRTSTGSRRRSGSRRSAASPQVSYNNTVKSGRWFCGGGGNGTGAWARRTSLSTRHGLRSGLLTLWQAGAHADWYPVKNLRLASKPFGPA